MFGNKLAISSLSLGQHPSHLLDHKIIVAASHGFAGIEIVFSDLEVYARAKELSFSEAAEDIRRICETHQVEILSLAPFENFEGHNSPLEGRLETAKKWINIARILEATYLQVPAQYSSDSTGEEAVVVSELQQLADIASAQQPIVAIAYEPMSWSTHCSTWQSALRITQAVDRPNFGLCLDSFHELTKLWASPFDPDGKLPNADHNLRVSLRDLQDHCPLDNIFYVQLSDGERFDPPFSTSHPWYLEGDAPQFIWSRHARPFPLETQLGAYMPLQEVVKSWIADKGFNGWVSLETFDRRMRVAEFQSVTAAQRGRQSWHKLQDALLVINSNI
ncbi:hypothetical protein ETB97_012606 [Aspergillus alliaceus]|uniref:Xylose isomerase-like TIM barrel domain-containing protein n=1 Tax=Petromyces alliaceus TaxID=209559 RepID=A0A8H6A641_PETAA|nr:hypothetical protein ETB97_012606 [Aspergillus burnettii]